MDGSSHGVRRGSFLRSAGLGLAAATFMESKSEKPAIAAGGQAPPMAASTPQEALALLKAGNGRFVEDRSTCGPLTPRRLELTQGQAPFAIILGCSDSRVPIETVFDQVPGHLFVVRVAGNFLNDDDFGSIEYAIAVLKSKFVLVLGHEACGAVTAAVDFVKDGKRQPGHIQSLVDALAPAAKAAKGKPGDWIANAIEQNVRIQVGELTVQSDIIKTAVDSGSVGVAGGVYDLQTGKVHFL
ncbi:MAG: carbonic anhydrase [Candidatus Eremiobacteraeota bacterium]|nr:carbonic anhydrase [Candidatus Eremiobacteraeota bacterium]MBV8722594.1 carbonic anhydrase [Candidatus Eremiobacteraeota bacterium]